MGHANEISDAECRSVALESLAPHVSKDLYSALLDSLTLTAAKLPRSDALATVTFAPMSTFAELLCASSLIVASLRKRNKLRRGSLELSNGFDRATWAERVLMPEDGSAGRLV